MSKKQIDHAALFNFAKTKIENGEAQIND